jgi:hypothetical protein
MRMNRFILGCLSGEHGDHINHDTLDNRRGNLRKATPQQNAQNMRPRKGGSSQYKGVSWHKSTNNWQAQIRLGGKEVYLGLYATEQEAALVYDEYAKQHFGPFAHTNFE